MQSGPAQIIDRKVERLPVRGGRQAGRLPSAFPFRHNPAGGFAGLDDPADFFMIACEMMRVRSSMKRGLKSYD